jgi:putative FmdB family regulatory protein
VIYSFVCKEHGEFDKDLPISSSSETLSQQPCPQCNKNSTRKYNTVGVIFKGTGFYVTDTPGAKHSTV